VNASSTTDAPRPNCSPPRAASSPAARDGHVCRGIYRACTASAGGEQPAGLAVLTFEPRHHSGFAGTGGVSDDGGACSEVGGMC
jgi:hypothetical protein